MKRIIYRFLPLLLIYLSAVIIFSSPVFSGDEGGYAEYARLISQGYAYFKESTLWWGPGYPIVLAPFVLLKLPWLAAKLLNAFFLFGSLVYFYKTLGFYLDDKYAIVFTIILGLYPPFFMSVHQLLTESFVFFLICGFLFHYCRSYKEASPSFKFNWPHLLAASFYLGYLALTKVFFGYVILAGVLIFLFVFMWNQTSDAKKGLFIYLAALILCVPYLLYTYSRTGKVFYWGTSGGMSLYWMSTSYSVDELGSWFSITDVMQRSELSPHLDFFKTLTNLSEMQLDEAFKEEAVKNITQHPEKYIINWVANIGRMVFFYPFSYKSQRIVTYLIMLPNMFIMLPFIFSIYPAFVRRRSIPYELYGLMVFGLIVFFGTSLLSTYERQFRPLIPVLLFWLSFIYIRILKIEIRSDAEITS